MRYNFFPTTPQMIDYESLNRNLYTQLTKDRNRQHYNKKAQQLNLIAKLFIFNLNLFFSTSLSKECP